MLWVGQMAAADKNKLLEHQMTFAWSHFSYHAAQRIQMFNFFIVITGALLAAIPGIGALIGFEEYKFVPLWILGFVSTIFLALDVRNTQMLEMSENVLEYLEKEYLFKGMSFDNQEVTFGILHREKILKDYLKTTHGKCYKAPLRWICFDNIKHKTNIRIILIFTIISSWLSSVVFNTGYVSWTGLAISVVWMCWTLFSPVRNKEYEEAVFKLKKDKPKVNDAAKNVIRVGNQR